MNRVSFECLLIGSIFASVAAGFIVRPAVGFLAFGASTMAIGVLEMCVDLMRRP